MKNDLDNSLLFPIPRRNNYKLKNPKNQRNFKFKWNGVILLCMSVTEAFCTSTFKNVDNIILWILMINIHMVYFCVRVCSESHTLGYNIIFIYVLSFSVCSFFASVCIIILFQQFHFAELNECHSWYFDCYSFFPISIHNINVIPY